jgi:serine/threonine protein kinase
MVDRLGQQIGNYRLTHILGTGGFADVYLGEHIFLKSHAAIKLLHTQDLRAITENFLNEAQTIARLKHPHIVHVHDFGIDLTSGVLFLVMDYAPHGSLRQCYPEGRLVPLATVVSYVKQVASALQYAHDAKVIHRDIKPENMLLGDNQEVIVTDFGLATVAHRTVSLQTQGDAGTIFYMAPEQIHGKPRPASDQYALGVTAYEWLCGTRPFSGEYAIAIAMQHVTEPPPPLRQHVPELAANVEQVVLKALAKDPQHRFVQVQDFAEALEQAFWTSEQANSAKVPPLSFSSSPVSPAASKMTLSANGASWSPSAQGAVSQPLPRDGSSASKAKAVSSMKAIAVPQVDAAHQTPLPSVTESSSPPYAHVLHRAAPTSNVDIKPLGGTVSSSNSSLLRPPSPLSTRPNNKNSYSRRRVMFLFGILLVLLLASAATLTLTIRNSFNNVPVKGGPWSPTGSLAVARFSPRLTRLQNGMVLLEGGNAQGVYTSDSELFNPSTSTWTSTGSLNVGRTEQTATLLSSGKVLVAGGYAGPVLNSAELYDPVAGTWTFTGSMIQLRTRHTATLLSDGTVLVVGGWDGTMTNTAERYDPGTGSWSMVSNMLIIRADHTATLLPNGKVLIAGGAQYNNTVTGESELYDPATNTWSPTGSMNVARSGHTAVLLPNGEVLAIGGSDATGAGIATAELYDPTAGTWTLTSSMNHARAGLRDQNAQLLSNGTVLIAGGDSPGTSEVYTPATQKWSSPTSMGQVHCSAGTVMLSDGKVLIAAGFDCVNLDNKNALAELYIP